MSVIDTSRTGKSWQHQGREPAVLLYLDVAEGNAADLVGAQVAGFPL